MRRWFKHSVAFSYALFSHSLNCMICTSGFSVLLCLHICFWFKNWFWSYHLLWINVPQVVGGEKIHYWQKLKYREITMETLAFNVFICWNGLAPTADIVTLIQLQRVVLWKKKCNLRCPKFKMHNRIYRNVSFLMHRLKFPTFSMGILCVSNYSLLTSRTMCEQ